MTDPFDIYNNTGSPIVCANGTIPANGYISVNSASAKSWAIDPIVQMNLWMTNIGVSVYGNDFGYGYGSQSDIWLQRLASGAVQY